MFLWTNLLRGCKNCNNAKRDRFPLDETGGPLLIDPAREEPLDYFAWDFLTGKMVLHPDANRQRRAEETRNLLDLDQEPIREERRQKLETVTYLLAQVVNESPISADTEERLCAELLPHRPWLGIVRQLFTRPAGFEPLVTEAIRKLPPITDWIKAWM